MLAFQIGLIIDILLGAWLGKLYIEALRRPQNLDDNGKVRIGWCEYYLVAYILFAIPALLWLFQFDGMKRGL